MGKGDKGQSVGWGQKSNQPKDIVRINYLIEKS
uniref:MSTP100 n=1 Tax=Homo sapiens TaxID=9606 RepID=Q7Z4D9_HUMAN|nr:MSTP100 [Homo sapiens]